MNLTFEKAELDMELQLALVEGGFCGGMIKHPLVNEIFYVPEMNSHYNKVLACKKEAVAEAYAKKEWHHYIFLHEKPWRAPKLSGVIAEIGAKEYWPLVASVWMDSENIWQNKAIWKKMLASKVPNRNAMMNPKELAIFKALCAKETVTLHRGLSPRGDKKGFSWTTDKEKAIWFSKRLNSGKAIVITKEAPTSQILCYLDGRGEKEVIWLP